MIPDATPSEAGGRETAGSHEDWRRALCSWSQVLQPGASVREADSEHFQGTLSTNEREQVDQDCVSPETPGRRLECEARTDACIHESEDRPMWAVRRLRAHTALRSWARWSSQRRESRRRIRTHVSRRELRRQHCAFQPWRATAAHGQQQRAASRRAVIVGTLRAKARFFRMWASRIRQARMKPPASQGDGLIVPATMAKEQTARRHIESMAVRRFVVAQERRRRSQIWGAWCGWLADARERSTRLAIAHVSAASQAATWRRAHDMAQQVSCFEGWRNLIRALSVATAQSEMLMVGRYKLLCRSGFSVWQNLATTAATTAETSIEKISRKHGASLRQAVWRRWLVCVELRRRAAKVNDRSRAISRRLVLQCWGRMWWCTLAGSVCTRNAGFTIAAAMLDCWQRELAAGRLHSERVREIYERRVRVQIMCLWRRLHTAVSRYSFRTLLVTSISAWRGAVEEIVRARATSAQEAVALAFVVRERASERLGELLSQALWRQSESVFTELSRHTEESVAIEAFQIRRCYFFAWAQGWRRRFHRQCIRSACILFSEMRSLRKVFAPWRYLWERRAALSSAVAHVSTSTARRTRTVFLRAWQRLVVRRHTAHRAACEVQACRLRGRLLLWRFRSECYVACRHAASIVVARRRVHAFAMWRKAFVRHLAIHGVLQALEAERPRSWLRAWREYAVRKRHQFQLNSKSGSACFRRWYKVVKWRVWIVEVWCERNRQRRQTRLALQAWSTWTALLSRAVYVEKHLRLSASKRYVRGWAIAFHVSAFRSRWITRRAFSVWLARSLKIRRRSIRSLVLAKLVTWQVVKVSRHRYLAGRFLQAHAWRRWRVLLQSIRCELPHEDVLASGVGVADAPRDVRVRTFRHAVDASAEVELTLDTHASPIVLGGMEETRGARAAMEMRHRQLLRRFFGCWYGALLVSLPSAWVWLHGLAGALPAGP